MDIDRFWGKVQTGQLDECWPWRGARYGTTPYGSIRYQGRAQGAHRVSYQINIGPIPEGYDVLHRCDNPSCVNPAHLWLGTHAENMRDMKLKGRAVAVRGEAQPKSKLTEDDVRTIRQLLKEGISHRNIAERFGVRNPTISYIKHGKRWGHIKDE